METGHHQSPVRRWTPTANLLKPGRLLLTAGSRVVAVVGTGANVVCRGVLAGARGRRGMLGGVGGREGMRGGAGGCGGMLGTMGDDRRHSGLTL